jgi:hypothetical protein
MCHCFWNFVCFRYVVQYILGECVLCVPKILTEETVLQRNF